MRLAVRDDIEEILSYLKGDVGNCIYLYMDIKKYGLDNSNMKVWINEGKLNTVVMKYYSSIQIYSTNIEDNLEEVVECICEENVQMVSGEKSIIDIIYSHSRITESYEAKSGEVFEFTNYREYQADDIELANESDMEEVAELICMDESFSKNYAVQSLAQQLKERMQTGMGRNYIIRKDGKIIAHIATFVEVDKIAVTSGLIVHPEYRKYPYGTILESYLVNTLLKEEYQIFTFINDKKRTKLLQAMKNKEYGKYKKLMKV